MRLRDDGKRRGYLGRQVGVIGTCGYMPEQRAQHVIAQHVNVLDGQRLSQGFRAQGTGP